MFYRPNMDYSQLPPGTLLTQTRGIAWPIIYRHGAQPFEVYPTVHQGTLNHGLSLKHFQTGHPTDPMAGFFPTAESLDQERSSNGPVKYPLSALGNLRGGFKTDEGTRSVSGRPERVPTRVRPVTVRPGEIVFRFAAAPDKAEGPWWSTKAAMADLLLIRETQRHDRIVTRGVTDATNKSLLERARFYSAVLESWSTMEYITAATVIGPVRGYLGVGETINSGDEHYDDNNFQLYIPNIRGRLRTAAPGEPRFFGEVLSRRVADFEAAVRARLESALVPGLKRSELADTVGKLALDAMRG